MCYKSKAVKLYEFTITNNNKLTQQEVDQMVDDILAEESRLQRWASGFKCQPFGTIDTLRDGSKQYCFQVIGQFQVGTNSDENVRESDDFSSQPPVAARPLDL